MSQANSLPSSTTTPIEELTASPSMRPQEISKGV